MRPVALTIGGSDPSGGAGIQADLKTFHQFGVYGEAVITLLTVQNTLTVSAVETVRPELVAAQIEAVVSDIRPGAIKTGALGAAAIVEAVVSAVEGLGIQLVVDPVMVSKHGSRLMDPSAEQALVKRLLPLATLVTPNIPEAEALTGMTIANRQDMTEAARRIQQFGARAVLVKGGHLDSQEATDVLFLQDEVVRQFEAQRVDTKHTHGTGCTYSAVITAGLAAGLELTEAVAKAKRFIDQAIRTAPGLGKGFGPVNHFAKAE
jgi:hydroxymethylpyrimidine/phosphomethylpyrimidine kinase